MNNLRGTFSVLMPTIVAVLLLSVPGAYAAPVQIVNDNFNGPGETPNDDAVASLDVAWSRIQPSANASFNDGQGVGGTRALGDTGSSNKYRGMIGLLPITFSLSDIGDSIVLETDFRSNNAPALPSVADGYRVGLFGTNTGYFMDIGVSTANSL